ncbi:MAG: DUF5666 domain-containing protein [Anaerolineae bacterium]
MKSVKIFSVLLVLFMLGAGMVASPALAAEPADSSWVRGRVASIEGTTITVDVPDGSVKVITDASTCFWKPDVASPTLADIKVGEAIVALGEPGEEGKFKAGLVAAGQGLEIRRNAAIGQITAIEGTTLTLERPGGNWKDWKMEVETDSATCFWKDGRATLSDFASGDFVVALARSGEKAKAAVVVWMPLSQWARMRDYVARGRVASIEGNALTLETPAGDLKVLTDENTRFWKPDVEKPTLADFAVGDFVVALERFGEEGAEAMKADIVIWMPAQIWGGPGRMMGPGGMGRGRMQMWGGHGGPMGPGGMMGRGKAQMWGGPGGFGRQEAPGPRGQWGGPGGPENPFLF